MIIATCNFGPAFVKKYASVQRLRFVCLFIAMLVGALSITACSSAKGTDLKPREEILKTLRAEGFVFNKFVISTEYGDNENQVIVSGQLARKTPDNTHVANGVKLSQYRKIVIENTSGTWEIVSAPQIERDQFTSRDRWKN